MSSERIRQLSKRFEQHDPAATDDQAGEGRQTESSTRQSRPTKARTRKRERQSLYLDADLMRRLDRAFGDTNHAIYPRKVSKAAFLETIIEYGLTHMEEITGELPASDDSDDTSDR